VIRISVLKFILREEEGRREWWNFKNLSLTNSTKGVTYFQCNYFTVVVGGDATHIVMYSGEHGDWLLGDIHSSESHGCLLNT
jgi:hypothetical protein